MPVKGGRNQNYQLSDIQSNAAGILKMKNNDK